MPQMAADGNDTRRPTGGARRISSDPAHVDWPAIGGGRQGHLEAIACMHGSAPNRSRLAPPLPPLVPPPAVSSAATLIRQPPELPGARRADRHPPPTLFYRIARSSLAASRRRRGMSCRGPPQLHLGIFVHRVTDLPPGLYLLEARTRAIHDRLRGALKQSFLWETADALPGAFAALLPDAG